MPNKASDEFSLKLEQAKKNLLEKESLLKEFSAFSFTQAKRDAEDAVKKAKEAVLEAQKAYDQRWGRQINLGLTPKKRAQVHQDRRDKELESWRSDLDELKAHAADLQASTGKVRPTVSVSNSNVVKVSEPVPPMWKIRDALFAVNHNKHVAKKMMADQKLSADKRDKNKDQNQPIWNDDALLPKPSM